MIYNDIFKTETIVLESFQPSDELNLLKTKLFSMEDNSKTFEKGVRQINKILNDIVTLESFQDVFSRSKGVLAPRYVNDVMMTIESMDDWYGFNKRDTALCLSREAFGPKIKHLETNATLAKESISGKINQLKELLVKTWNWIVKTLKNLFTRNEVSSEAKSKEIEERTNALLKSSPDLDTSSKTTRFAKSAFFSENVEDYGSHVDIITRSKTQLDECLKIIDSLLYRMGSTSVVDVVNPESIEELKGSIRNWCENTKTLSINGSECKFEESPILKVTILNKKSPATRVFTPTLTELRELNKNMRFDGMDGKKKGMIKRLESNSNHVKELAETMGIDTGQIQQLTSLIVCLGVMAASAEKTISDYQEYIRSILFNINVTRQNKKEKA